MRIAGSMAAVLILQLLAGLVVVAVCLGISGLGLDSKSALVGVFIGVIPNAMYAWRVSRTTKRDPQKVLRSHYIAEAVKLVTTFFIVRSRFLSFRATECGCFVCRLCGGDSSKLGSTIVG